MARWLLALPAMLHGEWLALPVNLLVALIFSVAGRFLKTEEVWSFSPLIDLSVYRWVRGTVTYPHLDRQMLLLLVIMVVQFSTSLMSQLYPQQVF